MQNFESNNIIDVKAKGIQTCTLKKKIIIKHVEHLPFFKTKRQITTRKHLFLKRPINFQFQNTIN